jgi:hypothetical protein
MLIKSYWGNLFVENYKICFSQNNIFFSVFGVQVVLQWIPGHTGIKGNDKADMLAKRGASSQQPNKPVAYTTAKQIIREKLRKNWWEAGKTGRVVYNYKYMDNLTKIMM